MNCNLAKNVKSMKKLFTSTTLNSCFFSVVFFEGQRAIEIFEINN